MYQNTITEEPSVEEAPCPLPEGFERILKSTESVKKSVHNSNSMNQYLDEVFPYYDGIADQKDRW